MNAAQRTGLHTEPTATSGEMPESKNERRDEPAILNMSVHQQPGQRQEMGSIQGSQSSAQTQRWMRNGEVEKWRSEEE